MIKVIFSARNEFVVSADKLTYLKPARTNYVEIGGIYSSLYDLMIDIKEEYSEVSVIEMPNQVTVITAFNSCDEIETNHVIGAVIWVQKEYNSFSV